MNKLYTSKKKSLHWINSVVVTTHPRCSIANRLLHSFSLSIDSLASWRVEEQTLIQVYLGFIRRP